MIDTNQIRRLYDNGDLCCATLVDLCDELDEARLALERISDLGEFVESQFGRWISLIQVKAIIHIWRNGG